ncbi:MAG TPA: arylamine N-acetyltransferase [Rhizomicrobium sp.]|nr:arylamine N-acetyltransferase [Rhizomicrobium sp.]
MNLSAYLARINLPSPPEPTLSGLKRLHRAHLLAVPFENLEVQLGRRVGTSIPPIFEKIVENRRGGWCYEMNGLFGWALSELGFRVTRLAGGVMRAALGEVQVGNHLVLRVDLDEGPVFADVGFGSGPIEPFAITPRSFMSHGFPYSLSRADGDYWRMTEHRGGNAFSYDVKAVAADEALLSQKCEWLQDAPESPFVQNLVVQKHTPDGIAILRGRVLKHFANDRQTDERLIGSAGDLVATLRREFDLDVPEAATLWGKIVERHGTVTGMLS